MHVMLADLLGWDMTDRGGPYPQMAQTKKMQTLFAPPPPNACVKNGRKWTLFCGPSSRATR